MWKIFVVGNENSSSYQTARLKINSLSENTAIFLDIIQVQRHVVTDFR